jgi:hypothetical protein
MDLEREDVMVWLRKLIATGCVVGDMNSPPCSMWSKARHRPLEHGLGPRPVRSREKPWEPLPGLSAREVTQHALSSLLALACLEIYVLVWRAGGLSGLEHPADPGREPYPSLFASDHCKFVQELVGGALVYLDQCEFGACSKKPTNMMFSEVEASDLDRHCTHPGGHPPLRGLSDSGDFKTTPAAAYPSDLNQSLAQVYVNYIKKHGGCARPRGQGVWRAPWQDSDVPALRLTRQLRALPGRSGQFQR